MEEVVKEKLASVEKRLDKVELVTEEIHKLSLSVERMAVTIEQMLKQQVEQEKRINSIEKKDSEMWRTAVKYVITATIGAIIGIIFKGLGMV